MSQASTSTFTGQQLRTLVTAEGQLQMSLVTVETPAPAEHEVVIRIEAAPSTRPTSACSSAPPTWAPPRPRAVPRRRCSARKSPQRR